MNAVQQEDLLIELAPHEVLTRKAMVSAYQQLRKLQFREERFLDFLRDKLEIEGYWKMVGLA